MVKDLYKVAFSHILNVFFIVIWWFYIFMANSNVTSAKDIVARRYAIHKFDLLEVYKDNDGLPGEIEPKSPSWTVSVFTI